MTILILGASGFIGNACYEHFSKQHAVSGVDLIDHYSKGLILETETGVIEQLIRDKQFQVIINCAGSANIQKSFSDPKADFLSNTAYVERVLVSLKDHSPHTQFINISSAAVYGNPTQLPVSELADTHPLSPYGTHKLMSEELLSEYNRLFKIPTSSVRIFSAYGTGLKKQFFYDLYQRFHSDPKQITLFGTGYESRDFIFISDLVEALDLLITKAAFKGEVYNLASGVESFIHESASLFAGILNYSGKIHFSNEQLEGYPLNWQADISKLKSLGFEPAITLQEGLRRYAQWLKNNPG